MKLLGLVLALSLVLTACSNTDGESSEESTVDSSGSVEVTDEESLSEEESTSGAQEGSATAKGFNGDLTVTVKLEDGKLVETPKSLVANTLPQAMSYKKRKALRIALSYLPKIWKWLAEHFGVDTEQLMDTITTFNANSKNNEDPDFNLRMLGWTIEQGPFYMLKAGPAVHHTMGGLKINTDAQVLDTDGNPIEGLYAAGEVTGGIHGNNRLGSAAIADITVFGRIAGENAANYSLDK